MLQSLWQGGGVRQNGLEGGELATGKLPHEFIMFLAKRGQDVFAHGSIHLIRKSAPDRAAIEGILQAVAYWKASFGICCARSCAKMKNGIII